MDFQEMLDRMRFEHSAEIEGSCTDDFGIVDQEKVEQSDRLRTLYDYLLARGFTRFQLSAHGVGRDVM